MRKTLFVLAMILLLALTACGTKEPLPDGTDSSTGILILTPSEDDNISEPTDSFTEAESNDETKDTSGSAVTDSEDTESTSSESSKQDTYIPPTASSGQEDKQQQNTSSEAESSTTPTETTPPASESTTSETEPETTETSNPPVTRPDSSEVASLVAMYINQYRSNPATVLPGLTQVAAYRSRELVANFAHTDGISACNALQYGEYVDMTLYGMSESDSYYLGYNREAIAKGGWGGTADEIAQRIAIGFKNSSSHWKYLGSSEYSYIAVGCTYDEASSMWYCCICVSSKDYGG